MKFLSYIIFRLFYALLAICPFWALYVISNCTAFILQYIIAYRKGVITTNIQNSFPDLSSAVLNKIIRKTYLNLSDLLLESIKGLSMSDAEIKKRHRFTNPELLNETYLNQQSLILLTGHFNNWEWGIFSFNYFLPFTIIGIYKPLSNRYIDHFLKKKRAKAGTILADLNLTRYFFEEYVPKLSLFYMAADQSPSNLKRARWLTFLNQDTPSIHGPEKYAKRYGLPVVYAHIIRVKRGYYEVTLEWICQGKTACSKADITQLYHEILEKDITKNPSSWIWSHRRWKHKHKKELYKKTE